MTCTRGPARSLICGARWGPGCVRAGPSGAGSRCVWMVSLLTATRRARTVGCSTAARAGRPGRVWLAGAARGPASWTPLLGGGVLKCLPVGGGRPGQLGQCAAGHADRCGVRQSTAVDDRRRPGRWSRGLPGRTLRRRRRLCLRMPGPATTPGGLIVGPWRRHHADTGPFQLVSAGRGAGVAQGQAAHDP